MKMFFKILGGLVLLLMLGVGGFLALDAYGCFACHTGDSRGAPLADGNAIYHKYG